MKTHHPLFLSTLLFSTFCVGFAKPLALFPLDSSGKLGEPTVTEHEGGSKVVERGQQSPHPHCTGFSPDGKYALVPDLGLDQIVIYKVDPKTGKLRYQSGSVVNVPSPICILFAK